MSGGIGASFLAADWSPAQEAQFAYGMQDAARVAKEIGVFKNRESVEKRMARCGETREAAIKSLTFGIRSAVTACREQLGLCHGQSPEFYEILREAIAAGEKFVESLSIFARKTLSFRAGMDSAGALMFAVVFFPSLCISVCYALATINHRFARDAGAP